MDTSDRNGTEPKEREFFQLVSLDDLKEFAVGMGVDVNAAKGIALFALGLACWNLIGLILAGALIASRLP
jgi:hypothetical protein